ncbi:RDD family protein [Naumannella halotolerans]|uniref:RDD family protein n=1 Tax=Naumannella halotolerans TaxID=993414 RepID=A0A4R7J875_9ACTN|nr:RDD family protein [Naumannella halotolerans]TDT32717.1 RDD family protein [Naumannella halotolerans]
MNAQATPKPEQWPGQQLGLPESGTGALASWGQRIAALIMDWATCTLLAFAVLGSEVIYGQGWERFAVLITFFLESAVLSALAGGSFGQLLARIAVIRLDGEQLGWRAVPRALLVSLALPALIIGPHRRGLQDLLCDTVVVRRR